MLLICKPPPGSDAIALTSLRNPARLAVAYEKDTTWSTISPSTVVRALFLVGNQLGFGRFCVPVREATFEATFKSE